MNEITPELISEIASRLYNEIPGANLVPKTETDVPRMVREVEGRHPQYRIFLQAEFPKVVNRKLVCRKARAVTICQQPPWPPVRYRNQLTPVRARQLQP